MSAYFLDLFQSPHLAGQSCIGSFISIDTKTSTSCTQQPLQLYTGLVASCILCLLALKLVLSKSRANSIDVDLTGVLPIAWLMDEPHLSAVEDPKLDKLREAGVYTLNIEKVVRRRRHLDRTSPSLQIEELSTEPLVHSSNMPGDGEDLG